MTYWVTTSGKWINSADSLDGFARPAHLGQYRPEPGTLSLPNCTLTETVKATKAGLKTGSGSYLRKRFNSRRSRITRYQCRSAPDGKQQLGVDLYAEKRIDRTASPDVCGITSRISAIDQWQLQN